MAALTSRIASTAMPIPSLTDQLTQLVATPSVSSHQPDWDMGNREVVELLATWL